MSFTPTLLLCCRCEILPERLYKRPHERMHKRMHEGMRKGCLRGTTAFKVEGLRWDQSRGLQALRDLGGHRLQIIGALGAWYHHERIA